jgi:adenylate cyclase class 2
MKEVEILVRLNNSFEDIKAKLDALNFQGPKHTLDVYFFDPKRQNLKPDKNLALKECFRLRSKDEKSYITYKIDKFDDDGVWLYSDEHETEIADFDSALEIIKHLGLEPLVEIDNTKYVYLTDKYEIVLEDVKGLGLFLEVELLTVADGSDIEVLKNEIRDYIESFGFEFEELNLGKPELMLKTKNNLPE